MSGVMEAALSTNQQLQLPQQRMARPEQVANLIVFLVSPEASYISGAIIPVDGGAAAHSPGMPFPKRRDNK
nr:SDR family oxidoreductase [Mesorhizobium sp. ESP-6-4]